MNIHLHFLVIIVFFVIGSLLECRLDKESPNELVAYAFNTCLLFTIVIGSLYFLNLAKNARTGEWIIYAAESMLIVLMITACAKAMYLLVVKKI